MIVYAITNWLDGHKYVGQTTRPLDARWKEHLHSARQPSRVKQCPYLYAAMNKYGVENFEISEIDQADTFEQLDDLEELWIAKLGTTDRNRGYNISFGGSSRPHPDTRAKLSVSLKGKPAWNKGKPMGNEHYQNVLKSGIWGENKPQITPAGKLRIREGKLGKNNPNYGRSETAVHILKWQEEHPELLEGKNNPMYRKDVSDEAIKQLRSIGFSPQRISKIVGCSQCTVGNRLRAWESSWAA